MKKKTHPYLVSVKDIVKANADLSILDETSFAVIRTLDQEGNPITAYVGNPNHVISTTDFINVDMSRHHLGVLQ